MSSVYFQTFGCQMNVADSDELRRLLEGRGFTKCEQVEQADLIIVNTCSVREHAEQRALGRIAEFASIKARRRGAKLWVIGCMAERLGDSLKQKVAGIDKVIGARKLENIAGLLDDLLGHSEANPLFVKSHMSDFVPVMRGCNNFCAYCIVPYVRGPEQSIPAHIIEEDIKKRLASGVKEIVLLGQNVNSYNDNGTDFPALLTRISSIDKLERLRFTTSHPKDFSQQLVKTMTSLPNVCHHIHLPVQAGSDRILSAMNRSYTTAHYLKLLDLIKKYLPNADLSTDLLVGFPTESEDDFQQTLSLAKHARYTTAFMFAYSKRDGTAAAKMVDDVPKEVKLERLSRLIEIQTSITREIYDSMIGKVVNVLFTDRQDKRDKMWIGQDMGCKRVLLSCDELQAGTILNVRTVRSSGKTLITERT